MSEHERKPLWTDEALRARIDALTPAEADMGELEYWNTLRDLALRVSTEVRDEYEGMLVYRESECDVLFDRAAHRLVTIKELQARVVELEAQLAQAQQERYVPVEDGEYDMADHWQTIENAIEIARKQQQKMRDHYTDEILEQLDAALAFVREMRQQQAQRPQGQEVGG